MEKTDQVVVFLLELRDSIEDLLDELVPPPASEAIEHELVAKPPQEGRSAVVNPKRRRDG